MRRLIILVLTGAGLLMLSAHKPENEPDEHLIKALFVYNFTKHVEWPQGKNNGIFTIGVVGNSPVYDRLNVFLKDRKIKDQSVELIKIQNKEQIELCDILYITRGENNYLAEMDAKYNSKGVLVVTEDVTMRQKSSCINIIQKDDRLKFELNDRALRKEGLKISQQLYELAEKIR